MANKNVFKDSEVFYFFACYDKQDNVHYLIASSFSDLTSRFGRDFLSEFVDICQSHPLTKEHFAAIDIFLQQQKPDYTDISFALSLQEQFTLLSERIHALSDDVDSLLKQLSNV